MVNFPLSPASPKAVPVKRIAHKSRGKTTGLGIMSYFSLLFSSNEVLPTKLTDDQIAADVEQEFPDRPSAHTLRGKGATRTVNEYRNRYNAGLFPSQESPPEVRSYRYNSHGQRVNGKDGITLLEDQTCQTKRGKHSSEA